MPSARVPASVGVLPKLTRRGVLVGAVASAVPANGLATTAVAAPAPDAALTALEHTFRQSLAAYESARRYFNACETRYFGLLPPRPAMLTIAGPLGHFLDDKWEWWGAAELTQLLKDEVYAETWEAARAALPVARAYEARLRRLRRATDVAAAEAAHNAGIDEVAATSRRILAAPAHSFAGFAVKARVVKEWGRPDWWEADADTYEQLAAQILDAVIMMQAHS
jgi:hypothetical protein